MDDFTQQLLQQMLINPNNYQTDIQPLLTLIKDGNSQAFQIFTQAIHQTLSSKQQLPLTKLTTLRLLKDTFVQGNVQYLQELDSSLIQTVLQIASYNTNFQPNPENKKQGRGDLYFIEKQNRQKDSKIIRYGNMYVNFAAQIICGFGKLYPNNIQGQSSIFQIALKEYKKMKGPVPPQKFFMAEDQKKFKQNLREWVKKYERQEAQREKEEIEKKNQEAKAPKQKEKQRKSVENKKSSINKQIEEEKNSKPSQDRLKEEKVYSNEEKIKQKIEDKKIQEKQKDEAVFLLPQANQSQYNKNNNEEKNNHKEYTKENEKKINDERGDYFAVRAMSVQQKKEASGVFQGKEFEKSGRTKQFWVAEISEIARKDKKDKKQEVIEVKKNVEKVVEQTKEVTPVKQKIIQPPAIRQPKKAQKIERVVEKINKIQESKQQKEVEPKITIKPPVQEIHSREQDNTKLSQFYETKIQTLQKRLGDLTKINNQYLTIIMNQLQQAEKHTQLSTPKSHNLNITEKLKQEVAMQEAPKKKSCFKTQKSRLRFAKTASQCPTNPYKENPNPATSSSIQNSNNAFLYRTEIKHLKNSQQLLKNTNNIKTSVFPLLKEYFAPLQCGENERFRKCCFLEPGDEKLFFEDQGIQIYIMKTMNHSHRILVANTNLKPLNVKIFSESSEITLRESSCLIGSQEKVTMSVQGNLVNLNFRFPVFNITIQSDEEQVVYRIPVPITLLSYTIFTPSILQEKHQFISNNLNTTQTKIPQKTNKSVPFQLGQSFRDLKRLFPTMKFTKTKNGEIQAEATLYYYFIPQIALRIVLTQNQSSCIISTQFEIDDRKPNEAFSKVILQVLMYLLS